MILKNILPVTTSSPCGSSTRNYAIRSTAGQPGPITGPNKSLCEKSGVTYSIVPVLTATGYSWMVPPGVTMTSPNGGTSITVDFTQDFTSTGNICVSANNDCGSGIARCYLLSAQPYIPVISGTASVCKSQSAVSYSLAPVPGALSYSWSVSGGASITPAGTNATVNFTSATSNTAIVRANANNVCGSSQPAVFSVAVNQLCRTASDDADLKAGEFLIYPNPTSSKATVSFNAEDLSKVRMNITDLEGKVIVDKAISPVNGLNIIELNLHGIARGVYLLNLQSENKVPQTQRLIVE